MNITSLSQTIELLNGSPLFKAAANRGAEHWSEQSVEPGKEQGDSLEIAHRFQLRLLYTSDTAELFSLIEANRAYLRQWLPWVDGTRSPDDCQTLIEQSQQSLRLNTGLALAMVMVQSRGKEARSYQTVFPQTTTRDDAIAGIIGLDPIDWPSRTGYISYWLAQKHQGQGIVTQACRALINYAFEQINLNRTIIACATKNKASRAIPERLGFSYDGRIHDAEKLSDRMVDHEVYVLLRDSHRSFRSHHKTVA